MNSLTSEELMSVFTHLNVGDYFKDVAACGLNGDIISNCETVEDVQEVVKMGRARARSLLNIFKKLRADGVPRHYLVPLGIIPH